MQSELELVAMGVATLDVVGEVRGVETRKMAD